MNCLNCKADPATDARIMLVRINEFGVDGVWLCRNCYTELLERDNAGKPVYLHAEDCPNYCDYACNGQAGFERAKQIKEHELMAGTDNRLIIPSRDAVKEGEKTMNRCTICQASTNASLYLASDRTAVCADCLVSELRQQLSTEKAARERAEQRVKDMAHFEHSHNEANAAAKDWCRLLGMDTYQWDYWYDFTPKLEQLKQRAETAEKLADERGKACAEMMVSAHWFDFAHLNAVLDGKVKLSGDAVRDLQYVYTALMKSDAGRDYIHKSALDDALKVLKLCIELLNERPYFTAKQKMQRQFARRRAEQVLKENQDETT